ncbi:MAG: efflux RND transporter permease subunit, partial [Stellaceae bacterium]
YGLTALVVPLLAHSLIDFTKWHDPAHGRDPWSVRVHSRILKALFAWPWLVGLGVGALVIVGYFGYQNVGTGFLPKMDEGGFVLDYQTAPGTSLAETNRELEEVEAILKNNKYVYTYSRRTGAGLGGDLNETYQGDFFVRLVDPSKRPAIWKVMDSISSTVTSQVPGIDFDTHQLLGDMIGDMVGRRQPVVIKLHAKDPSVLPNVANNVAAAIAKVPGIEPASVNSGVVPAGDALNIHVDSAAAALHGVTPAQVKDQVNSYLQGTQVTSFLQGEQDVGVRVWAHAPNSSGNGAYGNGIYRDELKNLPLKSADGHIFPLGSVAKITFEAGQPQITRENLEQIVAVTGVIGGGHDLGSTLARVKQALNKPGLLPPGVSYEIGGQYQQQQQAAEGMIKVAAAAVVAEIILLLFLYERLTIPVIIIVSSLISTSAVFAGLWITGVELNITA